MAEESKGRDRESSKKGGMIVLIAVGLVIIALLGTIVVLLLRRPAQSNEQIGTELEARGVLVTEDNVEDLLGDEEPSAAEIPLEYTVVMNGTWHFPDGSSPATDAVVENSPFNQTPVYFDVVLADTEETIYESPVIPLGETLREVVLMRDLDAGSYDCVVIYHLVDDEQRTLTTVRVGIVIEIAS